MAAAIVQQTGNQFGSVSSQGLTFPGATTTGNALIALVSTYGGNAAGPHANAITDSKGNTFTRGAARGKIGENAIAVYYCLNANGGASHTITFDPPDHGAQYLTFRIMEVSGLATSGGVNVANSAEGTVGNWTVNLVTTVDNCFLVGLASHDASSQTNRTYAAGSGYTEDHNYGNGGVAPPMLAQHREVGAAGTYAFDGTISASNPAWMVAAIAIPLAASSAEYERTVSATAALSTGNQRTVSATAALTGAATRTLPATAALSGLSSRTIPADAALFAPGAILAADTFTAANNTLVTDRQSDSGHDWVMQSGSFDDTEFIITNNRARSQVGGTNIGLLDYTPPDDYEALAIIRRLSGSEWGLWTRADDAVSDGYSLFWSGTRFDLYRYVGGSGSLIGNSDEHASGLSLSDGTTYWVKLRSEIVSGNVAMTAWIRADGDGDDNYTLMLDVTDSHAARHQAAGLVGLNMRNTGASTGMHTDAIRVQAVGTSDAGTLATEHERTVAATAATSATNTRTVGATAATSATLTRTVGADAALAATEARTVSADAALQGAGARTVGATAALSLAGLERTVTADAALSLDLTRTVEADAALSATITRTVAADAALSGALVRTVGADAALIATATRAVPATAALSAAGTEVRTVPATAALQATAARTVGATAAIEDTTVEPIVNPGGAWSGGTAAAWAPGETGAGGSDKRGRWGNG